MPSRYQPLSLDTLTGRRFSFYPAIRNIAHNEWTLEAETWSEIQARNVKSGQEIWIPRNHLGEISSSGSPLLIVGLQRELEYKAGGIHPYRRTVVEMPGGQPPRDASPAAAPEPRPPADSTFQAESRGIELIGKALLAALGLGLAAALVVTQGIPDPIERFFPSSTVTADQLYLGLTGSDNYHDVVIKLARPQSERWISRPDSELQFQVLSYPERGYDIILMGGARADARYIGALHEPSRKILDAARLPGGGSTAALLKNLPTLE